MDRINAWQTCAHLKVPFKGQNRRIDGLVRKLGKLIEAVEESSNVLRKIFHLVWKLFYIHVLVDDRTDDVGMGRGFGAPFSAR